MRPTEKDLFTEEQSMVSMSFGDHIEELRTRLILGLLGLIVGVIITFIPPLSLGKRVFETMEQPAKDALAAFNETQASERARQAEAAKEFSTPAEFRVSLADLAGALRALDPSRKLPAPEELEGKTVSIQMSQQRAAQILDISRNVEQREPLSSFGPMETFGIYFMVCIVTGLVLASPWVYYQIWAFIAAGLYRHERHYVNKFMPFSLGLFLAGVFLCFFAVLPVTLKFLLQFNAWLGIEPMMRLSEWMSFATMLPLIFGICFQTPLVMLMIERIGIVPAEVMRANRKYAILIMVIAAAIITPTADPFSLMLLAGPMIALYELGLILIGRPKPAPVSAA